MSAQNSNDELEYSRLLNNLSSMPGFNGTTNRKVAKKLLENEWVFCNGDIREIRVKNLGLGVYKFWSEQKYKDE